MKLLVVEDDNDFREFMRELFQDQGFEVQLAACAEQGIGRLIAFRPDILVADIRVPDYSDGVSLIMMAKNMLPACRVVAISGGSDEFSDEDYFGIVKILGVKEIMKKPIIPSDLLKAVNGHD